MAHKIEYENGQPVNKCTECNTPVHPALDCKKCGKQ